MCYKVLYGIKPSGILNYQQLNTIGYKTIDQFQNVLII